jgi:hypothetical protein
VIDRRFDRSIRRFEGMQRHERPTLNRRTIAFGGIMMDLIM